MNEVEMIEKARTDVGAMEKLLLQYKPLVNSIARKYFLLNGDMDDLVQEGMIGLYKAISTYSADKNASFKTFASICITRKIQTKIKKENTAKNRAFMQVLELTEQNDIPNDKENPEYNLIKKQTYEQMQKCIEEHLSPFEKKVLNLYLAGKNYTSIANELETGVKSVDNALTRVRIKLSQFLDDIKD